MTQPFDELESRGPWPLNRQTAIAAACGAAVLGVLAMIAVHGMVATVMLIAAVVALVSMAQWARETVPTEWKDQVAQLVATVEEHVRPWAGDQAEAARVRLADATRPWRHRVDAVVDRHLPADVQRRAAHMAMAMAAMTSAVALVLTGTASARSAPLSAGRLARPGANGVARLGRLDAPSNITRGTVAPVAPVVTPAPPVHTFLKAVTLQVPSLRGPLPVGKGMWIWLPERAEGGNVQAIVARAHTVGLTHLYVKVGSSVDGFVNQDFLARLLPVAHAAGIRVYGWDFPYLDNVGDDVNRAVAAARFTAPGGHHLDGLSADIELRSMGVNISPQTALAYGSGLRKLLGDQYPLIATVPRPSAMLTNYPFGEIASNFDALAPMVYWLNREAGADVAGAIFSLRAYGKPILPIGQAYDGGGEGGRPGVPSKSEIQRFMAIADAYGATSVSFWSWQHADQQAWDGIREAGQFTLPAAPNAMHPGQIRAYQALLTSLGFPVKLTNQLDSQTADAVATYQQRAHLPVTGVIDVATRAMLLTPFSPPIHAH